MWANKLPQIWFTHWHVFFQVLTPVTESGERWKNFYFFIFRLSNVVSVKIESIFKLSFGLSNILLIATPADNYIYKVGSFTIKIRFQNKCLVPIPNLQSLSILCNMMATKAICFLHFVVLKVHLFVEKFEEYKSNCKLDSCIF